MTRFGLIALALLVPLSGLAAEASVPAQVAAIDSMIEQGWPNFEIRPAPRGR